MSEYQYYEFRAIDRPLSAREMVTLRSYSTRAEITPTSFINEYHWGDFKGDEDQWMERYFDAFLYFANWGTRIFKVRIPAGVIDERAAKRYCVGDSFSLRTAGDKAILTYRFDDDSGDDWMHGTTDLSALIAVRSELIGGDLRALYLGWLLGVQYAELRGSRPEPPVPPGLQKLSDAQQSLAAFLRIDRDLLDAAACASPLRRGRSPDPKEIKSWVARCPTPDKDALIADLIAGADRSSLSHWAHRCFQALRDGGSDARESGRNVGQLLTEAKSRYDGRTQREEEERARERERRDREAALARQRYLDSLRGQEERLWGEIEAFIATKQPLKYDAAVKLLGALRDLGETDTSGDFQNRLARLLERHRGKPSLMGRIAKAGLC